MSCSAKFPNEINLACIFGLIGDFRNGVNTQTIKNLLWVTGCVIEKLSPPTLPQEDVSTMFELDLEGALAALEKAAYGLATEQLETTVQGGPQVGTQGWEVLIPILLELFKIWMENRNKPKPPPAPTPTAPVTRPATAESLTTKAPVTKPATAESIVSFHKK